MRRLWRSAAQADPDVVRQELAAFVIAGDVDGLESLCRSHRQLIEDTFADWWSERPSVDDPIALERQVQVLGSVAMVFKERLGRPQLLRSITGSPDDNPILRWQSALGKGEELLTSGDEDGAAQIGRTVLAELDTTVAGNLEDERAQANHLIGSAAFHSGHVQAARDPLEAALAIHLAAKTRPPIRYILDLFDVDRYLGDADSAATLADFLADNLAGDAGAFYRRQATILRAGEPLLRAIARVENLRYEIDDAADAIRASDRSVPVTFEYRRNRPSIDRSARATRRGMALASKGDDAAALAALHEATDIDPFDPQPAYQIGILMLDRDRWTEAKEAFEIADRLAPGWFFVRRYAWLADEAAHGNVRSSTVKAVIRADGSGDPADHLRILDRAIADDPDLAILHLFAGQAEAARGHATGAMARYRRGLDARHDPDVCAALQLALGVALKDTNEGRDLLERAVQAENSPYTAGVAQITMAMA
jgi:tetratricopeptide (TPR) repeat protein